MNITTNYYNEQVNNSITIIDNLDIAYNLYTTLMEDLNNKSSLPSFSDLFVKLAEIYNKSGFYHSPVLIEKSEELCYPMAMNMYWAVHISNKNNIEEKVKDILASKKYLDALYSTDSNYKSAEHKSQEFSKKKREIKTELLKRISLNSSIMTASKKFQRYRSVLLSLVETNDHKPLVMPEKDMWFYILNHNRTFYCRNKPIKAKSFKALYELLIDYERIYNSHDSQYDKELSAFMMEEMLHGLSYTLAFLSFLQDYNLTNGYEVPRKLLAIHYKLYDSPYINLVDDIFSLYRFNAYKCFNADVRENILFSPYVILKLHISFILPLLNYVITLVVNRIHGSKYDMIEEYLKDYIENCSKQPYTYSSKFEETMRHINLFDETLENVSTDSNSFKRAVLFSEPRKNRQAETLNQISFESFYENDMPLSDNILETIILDSSSPNIFNIRKPSVRTNRGSIPINMIQGLLQRSYFEICERK